MAAEWLRVGRAESLEQRQPGLGVERALVDDDPKFASTVRTGDRRQKSRRRLQIGAGQRHGIAFANGQGCEVGDRLAVRA